MRSIYIFLVVATAITASSAKLECENRKPDVPQDWLDMENPCLSAMKEQVQKEFNAAMTYLAMGAHFSRDTINRPGFAKMFFEAASEEREHGIKLIEYLLMRGQLTTELKNLVSSDMVPSKTVWENGVSALKDALKLEATVTKSIRNVIVKCEDDKNFNDYHLVDYLTGEFLEEQYKGQRDIAGKISTLDKMTGQHGILGEFLYDKRLLE